MSKDVEESLVETFNKKYPVGSAVTVIKDDGSTVETTVKAAAKVLGGHTPAVWLHRIRGAYSLDRVI